MAKVGTTSLSLVALALLTTGIEAATAPAGTVPTTTARPAFTLPTATTETTPTAVPAHTYPETTTARPAFTLPVETGGSQTATAIPAHEFPKTTTALPAFPGETSTTTTWSIPTDIPAVFTQRAISTVYAAPRRVRANSWAWQQKRTLRLAKGSKLVFRASAGKDGLHGKLTLKTATTVSRPSQVGMALVDLKAGATRSVVLKLSPAAVRAIKKAGKTEFVADFMDKNGDQVKSILITVSA